MRCLGGGWAGGGPGGEGGWANILAKNCKNCEFWSEMRCSNLLRNLLEVLGHYFIPPVASLPSKCCYIVIGLGSSLSTSGSGWIKVCKKNSGNFFVPIWWGTLRFSATTDIHANFHEKLLSLQKVG